VATDVLTDRALNRSLLARQLLLAREVRPAVEVVAHLVGMQAQEPRNPYVALWSRVEGFDPAELEGLLVRRRVVRLVVLRGTIHLVTADDAVGLRALFQPVLDRELRLHRDHAPRLDGRDLREPLAVVRRILDAAPRTGAELRAALAERFDPADAAALAFAARNRLGLVQVPPRGLWSTSGPVRTTTVEAWLGRPVDPAPSVDDAVLRYLAAFGPATPADVTAWSGLTAMREVLDRLRPRLCVWRDERGRELFDIPDAPVVAPDVAAPARFLPEYDNALLAHADRSRIVAHGAGGPALGRRGLGHVLHDGFHVGFWTVGPGGLVVRPVVRLSKRAMSSIEAEGRRLLRFLDPEAGERQVRFSAAG
jgi:hypothetical protein